MQYITYSPTLHIHFPIIFRSLVQKANIPGLADPCIVQYNDLIVLHLLFFFFLAKSLAIIKEIVRVFYMSCI